MSLLVAGLLLTSLGRRRSARIIAMALSVLLLVAALAGFLTFLIGIYVLPVALMLVVGSGLAMSDRREAAGSHGGPGTRQ